MTGFELVSPFFYINIGLFIIGFIFLIKGSDIFVESSSFIAKEYNISQIVIGLTVVSLGTSLPELATNVYASIVDANSISLGNVIGSNIANLCLVLAVGGILANGIIAKRKTLKSDGLLMILSFLLFFLLAFLGNLSGKPLHMGALGRLDGIIFLLLLFLYLKYLLKKDKGVEESVEEITKNFTSIKIAFIYLLVGLIMLSLGAKLLVDNVVWFASTFGIPQAIISATVVAFGTSVPELAVTVAGVFKQKQDIALGNIIGSCFFNIYAVLAISIIIRPVHVTSSIMYILIPIMIAAGIITVAFCWKNEKLDRKSGIILLALYLGFVGYSFSYILY